jgi:hypothetical protein
LSSTEETPVQHPVRNFFVIVALLAGAILLINFAADTLQQAEAGRHSAVEQAAVLL